MLVPRLIAAGMILLPISASAGQPHLEQCLAGKKWGTDATCVVDGDTLWLSGRKLRISREGIERAQGQRAGDNPHCGPGR